MYKYRKIDKELTIFAKNGDKTVKDVMVEYDLNQVQAKSRLKKLNLPYSNIRKPHKIKESHLIIIDFIKKEKRTMLEIMDEFSKTGYRLTYDPDCPKASILNAANYGTPQKRRRPCGSDCKSNPCRRPCSTPSS